MGSLIGEIRYALRQFWVARVFTRHRGAHARARHRRHDGDLHAHPRRHAAVAAGQRSVAPLPHRRRRQLLRAGRAAGSLGHVLVSALRAAEGRAAGVRGAHGVPGRRRAGSACGARTASTRRRGRCAPSTSPATTSRRSASARSAAACSRAADDTPAAPPVVVLSHHAVAGHLRRRSVDGRRDARSSRVIRSRSSASRRRDSSARRCAAIRRTCGFRCSRSR